MRTRILALLTALFLMITAAALAQAPAAELPVFQWQRDVRNHWQVTEDGEITSLSAHTLDDFLICTVCGSEIIDWGDGSADINNYDEFGNLLRYTSFDTEGMITYEAVHAYEYNEDGMVLLDREFIDGILYGEAVCTVTEDGEHLPVTQTAWNDDGTTSVNYYDEHGNCVRAAIFEADGSVAFETTTEYALNDDGWYYEAKVTSRFASGETFYAENNQYGDPTRTYNTYADGTPWTDSTYEYEYQDGVMVWKKQYEGGRLSSEEWMNEEGNSIRDIYYEEDGSTETWLYNDNGDATSVIFTRPDGSIDHVETYVYEYTEDMLLLCTRVYNGETLIRQIDYFYDEEQNMTGSVDTTWNEDGTRTVCEYDDWFDLVNETTYDADGNVIS